MKKLILVLTLISLLHLTVAVVKAEDTTCVSQYGGGVVCGTRTPEEPHIPVNAALGDVSPTLIGFFSLGLAGVVYLYSNKSKSSSRSSI